MPDYLDELSERVAHRLERDGFDRKVIIRGLVKPEMVDRAAKAILREVKKGEQRLSEKEALMQSKEHWAEKRKAIAQKFTEELMGLPPMSQHEEDCRTEGIMILKCFAEGSFEEYAALNNKRNG